MKLENKRETDEAPGLSAPDGERRIYFVRHGKTEWNNQFRYQGATNVLLCAEGREQARRAGAWFAEHGIAFDHVYSSTSERAVDMLELVLGASGQAKLPYERVKGLKEWNFGSFEGLTEDVNPPLPYGDFYVLFGGEGEMAFRERLVTTITALMQRPDHECVLMASHGAAVAQFLRAQGPDAEARLRKDGRRIGNCGITVYEFDPASATFEALELINPNE